MSQSHVCPFYNPYVCKHFFIMYRSFGQAINFKMITTNNLMTTRNTQSKACSHNYQKPSSKLCALIYEHFCWNTKSTQNLVQKCISSPLITFCPKIEPTQSIWKNVWSYQCILVNYNEWFNGLIEFKIHQYPSPMINKGCKRGVGVLNDAWTQSHTMHLFF